MTTQDDLLIGGLCVDGTAEDGTYQGDGESAPFVVFDIEAQCNLPGEYDTREAANLALLAEISRRESK